MSKEVKARKFLIEFNNTFPLDRWYRKKYNIPFNSPEHLAKNQIDIYFEWLEEQIFDEHELAIANSIKKQMLYEEGVWIEQPVLTDQENEELFNNIDI